MSAISAVTLPGTAVPPVDRVSSVVSTEKTETKNKAETAAAERKEIEKQVVQQKDDEVQVSKAAEARLLRSRGQSLGEIGATLGTTEQIVTGYLGITNGTQSLVAVATATVEAEASGTLST